MQDPKESISFPHFFSFLEYVPRLIKQNEEVKLSWHQEIKQWAEKKLKYKSFRLKIFNEFAE